MFGFLAYLFSWSRLKRLLALSLFLTVISPGYDGLLAATEPQEQSPDVIEEFADLEDDDWLDEEPDQVYDPLEPVNRAFFHFNDKLYFWLLRPIAKGYRYVVPTPARECVSNFFMNLRTPVRLVNNLLQGKMSESGTEFGRLVINTTVGVAGLWDPARKMFDLNPSKEDLGQTLGTYGVGEGVYICWPVFGPSNIRDSIGMAGDYFLDPVSYLSLNGEEELAIGTKSTDRVNETSFRIGDYESFKDASLDPYSAMRDAYYSSRKSKINDE